MTSRGGHVFDHAIPQLARKGGSDKGEDFLQFTFHVDLIFPGALQLLLQWSIK